MNPEMANQNSQDDSKPSDTTTQAAAGSVVSATAAAPEGPASLKDDNNGSQTSVAIGESAAAQSPGVNSSASGANANDPMNIGRHRRDNVSKRQMKIDHPNGNKRALKKFYSRQNELIDQFLGADDEEQLQIEEDARVAPRIKFAVNASFSVNFCLFVIQLYAAISTGSLSLFATAADAFMDLVSSFVMLITSRMAARASIYKYPVGRTRIETIGIILFCALMTTVAIQLLVESARTLGDGPSESRELHIIPIVFVGIAIFAKASLMVYCLAYRKYPSVHVFFIDHRNDIAVNIFGLVMSVVGDRFVWYLDPIGAICIALLILFSWIANAFEQVWLLVGKSAPKEFVSKVIYMSMTHDPLVRKVDTCRAYHAGQNYYVEVDIVMDQDIPLKISHDVSQSLQRKLEGLGDVERAFVHVDYDDDHDIHQEHKPLYEEKKQGRTLKDILLFRKKQGEDILREEDRSR
ncbi:cation efflux family-domain-containing protein [Annulohypoxylon maeteangense]|uniref:cation efflux family-domain-containing protein n=1 Tax=Annulohypoxylon maeteangense TaxID=1927788 RepID=UPI002008BD44|nr:cation efflux family-domain-containing protein [Annulohypoxylon maeteangense]KAI0887820.1 cation efflux family-domain-containing protein [Annulohypoxylon maeteangense]